ncbi:hypothetical protein AHAS_Ahas10G0074600 [Arachis hypogaea]
MNDAFMLKIIWQAMENPEALWVRVLSHKYCNGGRLNNNANFKPTDSCLWKELKKIWPVFQEHYVHYVSNGLSTYFWRDQWVEREGILIEKAINPVNVDLDSFVWEWTSTNGEWDLEKLRLHLLLDSIEKICHMSPPKEENEDDKVGWKLSIDGNFAVNTTYKSLSNWPEKVKTIWTELWSWKGPQRAKVFVWTAMHNRVMTNHRKTKLFGRNGECQLCRGGQEDLMHALRDCPKVSPIWIKLIKTTEIPKFFHLNWENWIEVNFMQQMGNNQNFEWRDIFILAIWRLWYWRNREIHEQNYKRPPNTQTEIIKQVTEIKEATERSYKIGRIGRRIEEHVKWKPPPEGWVKLKQTGLHRRTQAEVVAAVF